MKRLFVLIMMLAATDIIYAQASSSVNFDVKNLKIFSPGVYKPGADGAQNVDNMKAETLARANGIETISKYFEQSCANVNSSAFHLKPQWAQGFRSQGTEIYADGVLKVKLMASYKSVFQYPENQNLKTASGETLVFALPASMPVSAFTCGTPALEFNNNANQVVRIQIVPNHSQGRVSAREKIVKLRFDAKKNALIVANNEDELLLKDVQVSLNDKGATFLPVAVYAE